MKPHLTIVATLINDDGTVHRTIEVTAGTQCIREPVPNNPNASMFEIDDQPVSWFVVEWEPMVTIDVRAERPSVPGGDSQLVALWRRCR